jgi:TIR domain
MALVFISHAHRDEALVRRLTAFICDALGLAPADFFVSSQDGRTVAPAAHIRDSILAELASARSLIVVVTPNSAARPWVWLEAGNRLGRSDRANPLFVVPTARHVSLLAPVADLRGVQLDDAGQLHELVKAIGQQLERPVRDLLDYKPSLEELSRTVATLYSPWRERVVASGAWVRRQWLAVLCLVLGAALTLYGARQVADARREAQLTERETTDALNTEVVRTAARFMILKGAVLSGTQGISGATVMASKQAAVREADQCLEPSCTLNLTDSDGEFRIDLTRIQAENGDDIVLSVNARGFAFFSQNVRLDVRAMDVRVPSHLVKLGGTVPGSGSSPP